MAIFRKSRADGAQARPVEPELAPMIGASHSAQPMATEDEGSDQDPQFADLVRAMRESAAASLAAGVLATREKASLPGALRLWRQAYLQMYGEALSLPPQPAENDGGQAADKGGGEIEEPPANT